MNDRAEDPFNKAARLAALRRYGILDTPPEEAFASVCQVASRVCDAPVAVVNLIDDERQFFKAEIGLGVRETPVDVSICAHAILQRDLFVVPDTTKDPRFACNPLVTGSPHLRFYAGALLETPEGVAIGTMCVLDYKPRPEGLTAEQAEVLKTLARQVMSLLEQRRLIASLAEREAELERLHRIARIGALHVDLRDGFKNQRSPEYLQIHGLRPENADESHADWVRRIHPDDRAQVEQAFMDAVRGRDTEYEAEYRIIRPSDGEVRWIAASATIERDANGRALRLVGVHRDITDRKQAETANAQLAAIVSSSVHAIFSISAADGRVQTWNDAATHLFGYTAAEAIGAPANLLVPKDGLTEAENKSGVFDLAMRHGHVDLETVRRRKDGSLVEVAASAVRMHGADGRVLGVSVIFRDITQQKEQERALRASEERLHLALDASERIGTCVWEIQTDRVVADARFSRLFGVEEGQGAAGVPIQAVFDAIHDEDRARVMRELAAAVESASSYETEYRVTQKDGSVRWVAARGRCQPDASGRAMRCPGTVVDITDRKHAEEARELLTRELSHRIKNIFTVVNGLVTLSSRGRPEAQVFAAGLRDRLFALAQAHEYVRPHSPESAATMGGETMFGLLRLLLAPYLQEGHPRVEISGDDVAINEKSATALALILHEQATNAMKYGCLSVETGRVLVTGAIRDGVYRLTWREVGGPPVAGAPQHTGFGTVLAARSAAGQLGGELRHAWASDGLEVVFSAPIANLG